MRLSLLLAVPLLAGAGCRRAAPRRAGAPSRTPPAGAAALRLAVPRGELAEMVIEAQRKRVMGRLATPGDVARVADEDGPIVAEAARQPWAEAALAAIARDAGITTDEARARWTALEEADLMLESGGDPDAVSSAQAVGVAQWIAETGRRAGLVADLVASRRLTARIDALKRRVAWLEYLQRPDADPRAPGAPRVSAADARAWLPTVRAQLDALRGKRRRIDPRYDPRRAIHAHARYLLGLYARFPSLDWVFQAFHGGEAGVQRTLKRYLGRRWPGSAAEAVRRGRTGGMLRFEDVYFGATPRSHPAAFSYLYGRLDDHRYYWWKMLAARDAIALCRRDPAGFRRQWELLLPGRAKEATWYPEAPAYAFGNMPAVREGLTQGALTPVREAPGLAVRCLGAAPADRSACAALRPEAAGALRLLVGVFRRAGGKARLVVGDLALPADSAGLETERAAQGRPAAAGMPPDPLADSLPGGGPPEDYNFHATGLAFDVRRPAAALQWKTLEYALGWLCDRHILWWRPAPGSGPRRYHVVPNPRYARALARIGRGEPLPALPPL